MSKINIFVKSRNKSYDEDYNNFNLSFPSNLISCKENESLLMSITGFSCYNVFFNCNNNSNHFQIIFKNNNNNYFLISDFYLNNGNPNIYDIINDFNTKVIYGYCEYDKIKNYLTFYRTQPIDNNYFTMYIKTINSGSFFGLNDNTEYIITNGFQSIKPVNVNIIQCLNIVFSGISFKYNNIDNFRNGNFTDSNLVLHLDIDVPKNTIIKYENIDASSNFTYEINNKNVNLIKVNVYDQDYNIISDFPEMDLQIQFTVKQKNKIEEILKSIIEYIRQIYLILGLFLQNKNKLI
jgi:hypothetical protein